MWCLPNGSKKAERLQTERFYQSYSSWPPLDSQLASSLGRKCRLLCLKHKSRRLRTPLHMHANKQKALYLLHSFSYHYISHLLRSSLLASCSRQPSSHLSSSHCISSPFICPPLLFPLSFLFHLCFNESNPVSQSVTSPLLHTLILTLYTWRCHYLQIYNSVFRAFEPKCASHTWLHCKRCS